jgi:hypothetical protein
MDSTSLVWGYSFQQSFPLVGHTLNTILGNMTKKERLTKEINFANMGAGAYLCDCLWDIMEDHEVTLEDFEHKTKTWRVAVEKSACEQYEFMPYEDLWERIISSSFYDRGEQKKTAHETAEKVREYLLNKIQRHWDKSVNNGLPFLHKVRLSDLVGSGHELSIRDMDFDNLITDGLVFNTSGQIEQDTNQTELAL